jgi:sulfonate transport system ATP-binding protein
MSARAAWREFFSAPSSTACECDGGCDAGVAKVVDERAAGTPLLDVHVRAKRFAERAILRDVRLQLAAGEVVGLVGASGCGKSTLLRIVAGLDARFDGAVRLAGRAHSEPTRDIGFIFQEPRLMPWCSVADNIAFETGKPDRADPRVTALLAEVGLSGYEDALPRQLSGGQAQRVALARGLYARPRVLLLDEPFSAVDAFTRMRLQDVLLALVRRHGIGVLMVTHDVDEAVYLSDRVLVMEADPGGLREEIPVAVARPRDREASDLVTERRRVVRALVA